MPAIMFAARLAADGSVVIPKEAVDELGLHPGDAVQIQIKATEDPTGSLEPSALDLAVYEMTHRTPEQLAQAQQYAMERYQPRRTPPPGKTLADMVSGKWPGEETEEQIQQALAELS